MKKIIALLLAFVVCLSFAACGKDKEKKSAAVINVESLIGALPDLAMESYEEVTKAREKIEEAQTAYDALSTKEQKFVENSKILDSEKARLFENEYTWAALSMQYMTLNSDYVIAANIQIWNTVGPDDFSLYHDCVIDVGELGYTALVSQDAESVFWCAGYAFDEEYFGENFDYFSSTKISEVEGYCKNYISATKNVEDSHKTLESFIKVMIDDYSEEYSSKMEALQTWWVESSLYADHALNPSGSLNSYSSSAKEYQNNISRYQKLAGY